MTDKEITRVGWLLTILAVVYVAYAALETWGSQQLKEDVGVLCFILMFCGFLGALAYAAIRAYDEEVRALRQDARDRELQREAARAVIKLAERDGQHERSPNQEGT